MTLITQLLIAIQAKIIAKEEQAWSLIGLNYSKE